MIRSGGRSVAEDEVIRVLMLSIRCATIELNGLEANSRCGGHQ